MNEEKEQFTCYICGRVVEPALILRNVRDGWHIERCPFCRVAFAHPQPDAGTIAASYKGVYAELAMEYSPQKMRWARHSVEGYASILKRNQHSWGSNRRTLLDLGGGLGYYSKAFSEAGFLVTLVEQDPVSAAFARNVLKIENVAEVGFDTFFAADRKEYDVIFLRHVIEHVTNPTDLIRDIAVRLNDHGILIIETPNNAGVEWLCRPDTARHYLKLYRSSYVPCSFFSLIKSRPFDVQPPPHLFGFAMSNLAMLLEENSLVPIEKIYYRLGHPVYWPNLPLPTLRHLVANLSRLRVKPVTNDALEWGLFPLRLLFETLGLSAGMCIYAVKKAGTGAKASPAASEAAGQMASVHPSAR